MSDALNYLVKVRPQAMQAYLTFLKESSRSLDPKTRALITVITKVATRTEKGLRQYVPKALQAGATANEVLDAILHAFPALGLTKILWAIDILLQMDIPEFRAENLSAGQRWHAVAPIDELPEGAPVRRDVDDRSVFVYRVKNEFRVYDSRCPHQATNIPQLAIDGTQLTCPKHRWVFDLKTGDCIENGDRPLARYEAKVENGVLLAYW